MTVGAGVMGDRGVVDLAAFEIRHVYCDRVEVCSSMRKRIIENDEGFTGGDMGERYARSNQVAGEAAGAEETVEEVVAFFYEFARGDAGMLAVLDSVLKARYGAD